MSSSRFKSWANGSSGITSRGTTKRVGSIRAFDGRGCTLLFIPRGLLRDVSPGGWCMYCGTSDRLGRSESSVIRPVARGFLASLASDGSELLCDAPPGKRCMSDRLDTSESSLIRPLARGFLASLASDGRQSAADGSEPRNSFQSSSASKSVIVDACEASNAETPLWRQLRQRVPKRALAFQMTTVTVHTVCTYYVHGDGPRGTDNLRPGVDICMRER